VVEVEIRPIFDKGKLDFRDVVQLPHISS